MPLQCSWRPRPPDPDDDERGQASRTHPVSVTERPLRYGYCNSTGGGATVTVTPWTLPNTLGKSDAPHNTMAGYAGCAVARSPQASRYGDRKSASVAVGAVPGGTGRSSPPVPNARPSRASRPGHAGDADVPFMTSGESHPTRWLSVARRAGRRRRLRARGPRGQGNAQEKPASYARTVSRQRAMMRDSAPMLAASARIGFDRRRATAKGKVNLLNAVAVQAPRRMGLLARNRNRFRA